MKPNYSRLGSIFRLLLAVFVFQSLQACNPIFVMRAAYEQSKILVARRPIPEVIADPSTEESEKIKLCLVEQARLFTKSILLEPGETFTAYTKLDRNPVAWVASASRKDSFTPYTWWFPIVGTLPYKGFFNKQDAEKSATSLEEEGYETWVRGTAAFSTLGWFNDPLLSSTLQLPTVDVINTVIHETVHATIWIPNSVAFNESLANFVGARAAIDFFDSLKGSTNCSTTGELQLKLLAESKIDFERELEISENFNKLYVALEKLYISDLSAEQKIQQRDQVLMDEMASIRKQYPTLVFLPKVNNAEIMQRRLYLRQLKDFDRLFSKNEQSWEKFWKAIKMIEQNPGDTEEEVFKKIEVNY